MKNRLGNYNNQRFELVRQIALSYPGTEESISHEETPSIKVRGKLMCRLHDSGEFIPIRINFDLRDQFLENHPDKFHLPDHYKAYPYICMWTDNQDRKIVEEILELSWRELASKKQIKEYESR